MHRNAHAFPDHNETEYMGQGTFEETDFNKIFNKQIMERNHIVPTVFKPIMTEFLINSMSRAIYLYFSPLINTF